MDTYYSDELPQGFTFEYNGILVKGTGPVEEEKKEPQKQAG